MTWELSLISSDLLHLVDGIPHISVFCRQLRVASSARHIWGTTSAGRAGPPSVRHFSPHFGQTQEPPGPAAKGPPILPAPRTLASALRHAAPPPRPAPIPRSSRHNVFSFSRRRLWQPGIDEYPICQFAIQDKQPSTSSTLPQVKPITCTPEAINLASTGAEIAPQMRVPAPKLKNSAMRSERDPCRATASPRAGSRGRLQRRSTAD